MVQRRRTRFKDNFQGTNYQLTDGQTSPNGQWRCQYAGFGVVETRSDLQRTGSKVMALDPALPDPEVFGITRACKIDLNNYDLYNFEATFDMKTIQQNKPYMPEDPNNLNGSQNWEVAWFMWHYTDDWHHYYFYIQRNGGIEVGRKDYAVPQEQQQFLDTSEGQPFSFNQWYNIKVRSVANSIKIWVDGVLRSNIVDDGTFGWDSAHNNGAGGPITVGPTSAMYHGKCGFYCEDAEVVYDNFVVRAL